MYENKTMNFSVLLKYDKVMMKLILKAGPDSPAKIFTCEPKMVHIYKLLNYWSLYN